MENFNSSSIITPPPPSHCHCSPSLVVYKSSRPGAHTFLMQYARSHEPINPRILSSFLPKFPYHTFYTLFDCWCIKRNKKKKQIRNSIEKRQLSKSEIGNLLEKKRHRKIRGDYTELESQVRTSFDLSTFKRHCLLFWWEKATKVGIRTVDLEK